MACEVLPNSRPSYPSVLDAKGLALSFFNRLWDACSQWQQQVPSAARAPQRQWLVSIHAIRNTRRRMEDRHVCLPAFNQLFGLSVSAPPPGLHLPGPRAAQEASVPNQDSLGGLAQGRGSGKPLWVPSRASHQNQSRSDAYSFRLQAEVLDISQSPSSQRLTPPVSA